MIESASVVFPEPLSPRIPIVSPDRSCRLIRSSAETTPSSVWNLTEKFSMSMIGPRASPEGRGADAGAEDAESDVSPSSYRARILGLTTSSNPRDTNTKANTNIVRAMVGGQTQKGARTSR